jgi:two-component system response regulator ResD
MTEASPLGTAAAAAATAASPVGATVLVVEDEPSIGQLLRSYLQRDGYRVLWVRSGEDALVALDRQEVRIVLLDIGLPGMDGFEVCRRVRARSDIPVVMLTARDEEPDKVAGLEIGADDYVPKPFSPRELTARIKAVLRRTHAEPPRRVLVLDDVEVRADEREVTVAGRPVELTGKEFDLLAFLLEHPGIVFTRDQLLDRVWGMAYYGGTRTVDVHVAQLRRKLGRPDVIRTVRRTGYKAARS